MSVEDTQYGAAHGRCVALICRVGGDARIQWPPRSRRPLLALVHRDQRFLSCARLPARLLPATGAAGSVCDATSAQCARRRGSAGAGGSRNAAAVHRRLVITRRRSAEVRLSSAFELTRHRPFRRELWSLCGAAILHAGAWMRLASGSPASSLPLAPPAGCGALPVARNPGVATRRARPAGLALDGDRVQRHRPISPSIFPACSPARCTVTLGSICRPPSPAGRPVPDDPVKTT